MTRLPWRWRQPLAHLLLRLAVGDVTRYGLPAPAGGFLQDHPTVSDTVLSRITHGEVLPVPAIDRLDEGGVIFSDGRREPVDVIVWCTGYRVTIPYLSEEVLGAPPDELPLYLRIFPLDRSDLLFCGLIQSTGSALPIVERQGELMAAYLAGSWALPSQAEQRRWVERHRAAAERRYGRKRPAMRVDFDAYMRELARERSRGARRAGGSPPLQPRAAAPAGPVPA